MTVRDELQVEEAFVVQLCISSCFRFSYPNRCLITRQRKDTLSSHIQCQMHSKSAVLECPGVYEQEVFKIGEELHLRLLSFFFVWFFFGVLFGFF